MLLFSTKEGRCPNVHGVRKWLALDSTQLRTLEFTLFLPLGFPLGSLLQERFDYVCIFSCSGLEKSQKVEQLAVLLVVILP